MDNQAPHDTYFSRGSAVGSPAASASLIQPASPAEPLASDVPATDVPALGNTKPAKRRGARASVGQDDQGEAPVRGYPTAAQAIGLIHEQDNLSLKRKQTLASAVAFLGKVYAVPLEAIHLDPEDVRKRFINAAPMQLGIGESSHKTYISCIRSVLRLLGVIGHPLQAKAELAPAWAVLHAQLPDHHFSGRLQAFIAWCDSSGIAPDAVNDKTLVAYLDYLRTCRLKGQPTEIVHRCASAWNRAVKDVTGWPQTSLTAPNSSKRYTLPFDAYGPGLQADVERMCLRLKQGGDGDGLYCDGERFKPLKEASIKTRRNGLRLALAALVQQGVPAESIESLAEIVTPARLKQMLTWHWARAGKKVTDNTGVISDALKAVVYFVGLQGPALVEAKKILSRGKPKKRTQMTAKNERRLAQFDDLTRLGMLLHLGDELMLRAEALKAEGKDLQAAWMASTAVAIEIELHCPMRINNLAALEMGKTIVRIGKGTGPFTHLLIPAEDTKNSQPINWVLPPALGKMIQRYVTTFRDAIPGAKSTWLFPGKKTVQAPRCNVSLARSIVDAAKNVAGIELNPHLFRAFAGKLILDANPNAIEDLRLVLGHRTMATALQYYMAHQTKGAAERLDDSVRKAKQKTKQLAQIAFSGAKRPPKPPARRPNKPVTH